MVCFRMPFEPKDLPLQGRCRRFDPVNAHQIRKVPTPFSLNIAAIIFRETILHWEQLLFLMTFLFQIRKPICEDLS